jgi:hypothetical protein
MHLISTSVKEDVADSVPNLAPSGFLMLYREQTSTQAVLSAETQTYWTVHPILGMVQNPAKLD